MRLLLLTAVAIVSLGCGTCLAQVAAMPNVTMPPSSTLAPAFPGVANSPHATGSIQICPEAAMTGSTANFPVDGTDATTNAPAGFGTSAMSGNCNAASPASSPGIVSGPEFVDGSVPLSATEGGGSGLSPLIAVPISPAPSAACPSSPTPFDSAGATGTPSESAC